MPQFLQPMTDEMLRSVTVPPSDDAGFGALETDKGVLPLQALAVQARIDGLVAEMELTQTFVNTHAEPLEATYIFPLPDRAAVTRFRLEVAGRIVEGELKERGAARKEYDQAIKEGHRAAITEEERPGVFTMRVGNLPPNETARVSLTLTGPLPYSDGEATFRFPLVVAPRYIPGTPLPEPSVGAGVMADTNVVPDASRITPPVLLPGFPNPVQLSLAVEFAPSALAPSALRSSLHAVVEETSDKGRRVVVQPGERLNRDFILRFRIGEEKIVTSLSLQPDADGKEGTFLLTLVPPASGPGAATKPRDVVFVLDRSGSMDGWKIVAARRALARMVDALTDQDRFMVYAFDDTIETPLGFAHDKLAPVVAWSPDHATHADRRSPEPKGDLRSVPVARSGDRATTADFAHDKLVGATNRNRFQAVEFLAKIDARGGTEMAEPLRRAVAELNETLEDRKTLKERDRILVLVTDGQIGNEDQILRDLGKQLKNVRVFTLGVDRAVNEAFLRRLADLGGGASRLVESEDRLDEVMDDIHRHIGTAVLTNLRLEPAGLAFVPGSVVPSRLPDLFAGSPMMILGRYTGSPQGAIALQARDAAGQMWQSEVRANRTTNTAAASVWARGRLRELEDRYVVEGRPELEQEIVATSLRFGVLCRFTAFVAVDRSSVVNPGGQIHGIVQPVETPEGWEMKGVALACAAPASPIVQQAFYGSSLAEEMCDADFCDDFTTEFEEEALEDDLTAAVEQPTVAVLLEQLATAGPDSKSRLERLKTTLAMFEQLVEEAKASGQQPVLTQRLEAALRSVQQLLAKSRARAAAIHAVWNEVLATLTEYQGAMNTAQSDRQEDFWK